MSKGAIVCVDDEKVVLVSLRDQLSYHFGNEYDIELAESGEEALEIFEELQEDNVDIPLVISDQIMPGMKGDELLKEIHLQFPKTLKILLTGQANANSVGNAVNQANLYRYIAKPWDKTDLCLTATEAVRSYFQDKQLAIQNKVLQQLYAQAQQEIVERKQMIKTLRKFSSAVEHTADNVIITNKAGIVEYVNPAFEELTGYSKVDIVGLTTDIFKSLVEDQAFHQDLWDTILSGQVFRGEFSNLKKNQTIYLEERTITPIKDEQNNITHFVIVGRDITERKQVEKEHRRLIAIQKELTIAQEIQQSLLPPPSPNWVDLNVICYSTPAREMGGDFYQYYAFPALEESEESEKSEKPAKSSSEKRYALAVGDVSGKGVSAALLMATSLSQLDASFAHPFTPSERLAYLDNAFSPYTKPHHQNCALCYVELTLPMPPLENKQCYLKIANAGCIPPYIKRKNNGKVEHPEVGGFALGQGLGKQVGYQEVSLTLSKGDYLILTSDGVVEANNANNQMLGFQQLQTIIQSAPDTTAKAMLTYLKQEIFTFIGETELHDDLTIVVIQV